MNKNVGFAFPFRFDAHGRTATVGGRGEDPPTATALDEAVRAGALQVLQTSKGERVMYCGLGTGLDRWCFSPIPGFASMIPRVIREELEHWCPRAVLGRVVVNANPQSGQVAVGLTIRHNDATEESVLRVTARQQ